MTDEELKDLLSGGPVKIPPEGLIGAELSDNEAETPADAPVSLLKPDAPAPDETQPVPEQPVPEAAAPEPRIPDPFAEAARPVPQPDPVFTESYTADPAEKKPQRSTGLTVLLALMVLVICGFAGFCIYMDVQRGTVSGSYRAGDVIKVDLTQHARSGEKPADTDENGRYTVAGIAKNVMPSIVEIYTYADGAANGSGSGIILTDDGFIATNAHVVKDAASYTVNLYGQDEDSAGYEATLVGHDTKTDLAVLKIQASGLQPAELGDSDDVQLGETVCALGNPAGLTSSITTGIISGMNRKVRAQSTNFEMDCFQTDAAISPGNSGGALVDLYGRVIGITSSKYGSSSLFGGSYEGLGFAITVNEAMPIIKELMEQGYVSGRVRIGIQFLGNEPAHDQAKEDGQTLPKELDGCGILVLGIADDSDLKNTVFEEGNWILAMNGKEVFDYDSVNEAIEGCVGGDSVHCRCGRILDNGKLETFEIDFRLLEDQSGDY